VQGKGIWFKKEHHFGGDFFIKKREGEGRRTKGTTHPVSKKKSVFGVWETSAWYRRGKKREKKGRKGGDLGSVEEVATFQKKEGKESKDAIHRGSLLGLKKKRKETLRPEKGEWKSPEKG